MLLLKQCTGPQPLLKNREIQFLQQMHQARVLLAQPGGTHFNVHAFGSGLCPNPAAQPATALHD
jgi:hypothetical protein